MRPKTRLVLCLMVSAGLSQASTSTASAQPAAPSPSATVMTPPPNAGPRNLLDGYVAPTQTFGDPEILPLIFRAYRDNDLVEALILRSKLTQPAAAALADWFTIRSGLPVAFDRIAAFEKDYRGWPATPLIRRRAEEALLAERRPSAEVRSFFAKQPPSTGAGRIALAFALRADGLEQEAAAAIKQAWREDSFSSDFESRILERFPGVLSTADHRYRMERLLLKERWGAATRAAGYAGGDYPSLVNARMSIHQGKHKAEKAFATVPEALRADASYLFSRALSLRRSNQLAEAAKVIVQAPRDHEQRVDGDEWWAEQRLIARGLLDKGDPKTAYEVASHHTAESPSQQIEAECYAGWIALRFLSDPAKAAGHFATAANVATTPISLARIDYWRARAAEAAGTQVEARQYFERAASRPTTYYGQLAGDRLGRKVSLRVVEPLAGEALLKFEALLPIRALRLLHQIGEPDLALGLYTDLAQTLDNPGQLDALARLAAAQGNPRAVLIVGKTALQRGFPLDVHAYPLSGIPTFDPVGEEVEPAMILAVARQESAFNPRAVSSAGARGLMQLMPATAKLTAQRFGLGFDVSRLLDDPSYNAKLGTAHLGELMDSWKGSHVLTFASYNAGGGNVKKWIRAYGDPRQPQVDMVDWVERIPFSETRNYVQRVMENLQVYRQRLKDREARAPSPVEAAQP